MRPYRVAVAAAVEGAMPCVLVAGLGSEAAKGAAAAGAPYGEEAPAWKEGMPAGVGGGAAAPNLALPLLGSPAPRSPGASPAKGSCAAPNGSPKRWAAGVGAAEPGMSSDSEPVLLRRAATPFEAPPPAE